jgi:4-diphosphocytidyl-2-C-methyl-D-erythritol kinase
MIKYNSYAKINIGLEVLSKRADSFHEISTIISKIDLCDEIIFEKSDLNLVQQKGINQENNIIFKILEFMTQKYRINTKLSVRVIKKIPYSSGMGGGSSNAATTIEGINEIFNLNLDSKEKFDIGLKFGSDIPFFLSNSTAKISGRGDVISFIQNPKIKDLVIFHQKHQVQNKTKEIFINNSNFTNGKNQKFLLNQIKNNKEIKAPFFNGLEDSALKIFDNLKKVKEKLISLGINNLSMTGAGPTYYSVQENEKSAESIKQLVDKSNLDLLVIKAKIL